MARPRKVVDQIDDVQTTLDELRAQLQSNNEDAIAAVLSAFNHGPDDLNWKIDVHQVVGNARDSNSEPWLWSCDVSEIESLKETLQREVGAGRYRVHIWLNKRKVGQFDLQIAAPRRSAQAAPGGAAPDALVQLVEKQGELMQRLVDRLAAPAAIAPPDPIAEATKFASAMKSFQELGPKPDTEGPFKMFMAGIETALKFNGGGGDKSETTLLDIARDAIAGEGGQRVLGAIAGQLGRLAPGAPAQQPTAAQPQPVRMPAPPPIVPPADAPAATPQQLGQVLEFLMDKARAGADPALFAEWTVDNLPDDVLDVLERQPDVPAYLAQLHPEAAKHRAWLESLIEKMAALDDAGDGAAGVDTAPKPNGIGAGPADVPNRTAGRA